MSDLTDDEQKFFETGELPPELQAQADTTTIASPAVAPPVVATPPLAPTAPVASPVVDNALERMLAEERASRQSLEAKLAALESRLNPPTPPPNEDDDPLGAMMHQLKQMNETVAALKAEQTQVQSDATLKAQFDQFTTSVRQVKEAFEKTTPDFPDAYAHVRNARTEDLRMVGIAESEIPKILLQDELNIAQSAIARGKNPAEEVYNMAKRYGYVPKAGTINAGGAAAKLANLAAGAAAAKQPDRAAADNELTLDGLKDAGNDALNKLVQDDKMWAKIVGNTSHDIF